MILSEFHLSQHHLFRLKNKELSEIYAVMSIRSFIVAMVAIFIPIYLYTLGFSIKAIIAFELMKFIIETVMEYPVHRLLLRFGPKHLIALSLPFLVLHLWFLWTIPQYGWPLWLVALSGAIMMVMFWQAYHYDFSKSKDASKATREISRLYILIAALSALGPLIGGVIATSLGINFLFGIVTVLMIFTVIPLFLSKERHIPKKSNLKFTFNRDLIKQLVAYGGAGVEVNTSIVFWPIFMYLIVDNYRDIGILTSVSLLISVLVTFIIGILADKNRRNNFIKIGGFLTAAVEGMRVFVSTTLGIFLINFFRGVFHSLYESPFVARYYFHADEEKRAGYIFLMELATNISRSIYFALVLLASFYFDLKGLLIFALLLGAGITTLLTIMPAPKKELKNVD